MYDFLIPANFEDSGKILGMFSTRNVVEAVVLALPFGYLIFKLLPLSLTMRIIFASIIVIPVGGFALMGILNTTRMCTVMMTGSSSPRAI